MQDINSVCSQPSSMNDPKAFEHEFVHKFYEENASEFSGTRRKHWGMTRKFFDMYYTPESLVLDAGCGNGRSFIVPGVVGLDYCRGLLEDAAMVENMGLVRGDVLSMPFADSSFDLVMSVAVIHHFSTSFRRKEAMSEMRRVLKKGGRMLLYVWGDVVSSKRKFSRTHDMPKGDYFASWKLRSDIRRYYYLYSIQELLIFCESVGFKVIDHGAEEESLFVILEK